MHHFSFTISFIFKSSEEVWAFFTSQAPLLLERKKKESIKVSAGFSFPSCLACPNAYRKVENVHQCHSLLICSSDCPLADDSNYFLSVCAHALKQSKHLHQYFISKHPQPWSFSSCLVGHQGIQKLKAEAKCFL